MIVVSDQLGLAFPHGNDPLTFQRAALGTVLWPRPNPLDPTTSSPLPRRAWRAGSPSRAPSRWLTGTTSHHPCHAVFSLFTGDIYRIKKRPTNQNRPLWRKLGGATRRLRPRVQGVLRGGESKGNLRFQRF